MSTLAVALIFPAIADPAVFRIRYSGLERELAVLGVTAAFAEGQNSYNLTTHSYEKLFTAGKLQALDPESLHVGAIRDLTMTNSFSDALYADPDAPQLLHHPDVNRYLLNKFNLAHDIPAIHAQTRLASAVEVPDVVAAMPGSSIVVKPVTGQKSRGIFIGSKQALPSSFKPGDYLVQEFIDTSGGIEELGITAVHNLRIISVASTVIGAVGRLDPKQGGNMLGSDYIHGNVYDPSEIPQSFMSITDHIHEVLKGMPGDGNNVIAIDVMRGKNADGDTVDVLCEVNRRPMRLSPHILGVRYAEQPDKLLWLAAEWDRHEARMLAAVVQNTGA